MPPQKKYGYKLVVPVENRVRDRLAQIAHDGNIADVTRRILNKALFPGETETPLPEVSVQDVVKEMTQET